MQNALNNRIMKKKYKKIGLIAGLGPESTIEYYRLIINRFRERLKTKDNPEFILHSINMTEMIGYLSNNQFDEMVAFLAERVNVLADAGADYGAITANTPHIVFDRVQEKVKIPLISIVEEACKAVKNKNLQKVGLLGTKFTMTSGFYSKVAKKFKLKIIVPGSSHLDFIHEKYMNELIYNRIYPETKNELMRIVKGMKEKDKIEGLILGGTELPLILNQKDFEDLMVFDTTQIHVESIVEKMIGN
jgi:aspartate racemase